MVAFAAANATIQKALRALKAAGLVDSKPGSGVWVRKVEREISRSADFVKPVEDGEQARYGATSHSVEVSEVAAPADVAAALQVEGGAKVIKRSRLMVKDGKVVEIAASYVPESIALGTPLAEAARLKGGMPTALRRMGLPPRGCREWVDARMPTPDEIRELGLGSGVPVFRLLRLTWTDGERPVEALEIILGADRYRLEYDLPVD